MWRQSLFFKGCVVFGLFVLLTIPMMMIEGQVSDRQYLYDQVAEDISASYARAQTVSGPILFVPYKERKWDRVWNMELNKYERHARYIERKLVLFPEQVAIESGVTTDMRYRGIYGAPVYQSKNQFSGRFVVPAKLPVAGDEVVLGPAYLLVGVTDMRGVSDIPAITVDGQDPVSMGFGTDTDILDDKTLFLDLGPAQKLPGRTVTFAFDLDLNGTEQFGVIPAADNFSMAMNSGWPHPGFNGLMLPEHHDIGDEGFKATWRTNRMASSAAVTCIEENLHCVDSDVALNVDFVETVTGYTSVERAVKYSHLFILLSFAAFLLFEVMKKISIHGVQYLLVGMALAMFYLMLLALSEHISFAWSYLSAATACASLIGLYLRYVLHSMSSAMVFSAALSLVYAVLYVALLSEDYALLVGTGLLFLVLASIMLATRKVDWAAYSESLRANVNDRFKDSGSSGGQQVAIEGGSR